MKTWRETRIEQVLKQHDPKLFLNRNGFGELQVMRESFRMNSYDVDGVSLICVERQPYYIMSLTKDWTSKTDPVEWGLDPIIRRLQEIDGWNPLSLANTMEARNLKVDEAKERHMTNETEAFVKDWRSSFAKATKDISTNTLDKKLDSRRKGDRKYGKY